MKKLIALASAGAMLLSVSGVVFAHGHSRTTNVAYVGQIVSSDATSGYNLQVTGKGGTNSLSTGGDVSSEATGVVVANTQIGCNSCSRHGSVKNIAIVDQAVGSSASSGDNTQVTGEGGTNSLSTGGGVSSEATGVVVVNTSWTGGLPY